MPCWTKRTTTVALEAADFEVLKRGLLAAGFTLAEGQSGKALLVAKGERTATIVNGRVQVRRDDEDLVNEIKRAYSREAVKTAAKRFGYTVAQDKVKGTLVVGRRF